MVLVCTGVKLTLSNSKLSRHVIWHWALFERSREEGSCEITKGQTVDLELMVRTLNQRYLLVCNMQGPPLTKLSSVMTSHKFRKSIIVCAELW